MNTIYVRVTVPSLPESLRVSIYSCPQTRKSPEAMVAWLQAKANRLGLGATYERATKEDYLAHRAMIKAQTAKSISTFIAGDGQ